MTAPGLVSPEAEQSLLGAVLLGGHAFDAAAELITEADFAQDKHRLIWRHVAALVNAGKAVDIVTVYESLSVARVADAVGGLPYLNELAQSTPSPAGARRYAEIVVERSMRRRAHAVAQQLAAELAQGTQPVAEAVATAESELAVTLDGRLSRDEGRIADVLGDAVRYIDKRAEHPGALSGLTTGLVDLDALLLGMEGGQLIVAASRPGVGKSLFAVCVAETLAKLGHSVAFFSLEMPRREIGLRILSARAAVSVGDLRRGCVAEDAWPRLVEAQECGASQKWFIDDRAALTLSQIRSRAKRIARRHGLALIVVDYLQLVRGEGENRTQQIGSVSRGLKSLAKELQVPVLALAQLNRAIESRSDKRPLLGDLRESGEIEQDADVVVMLHREADYNNDASDWHGLIELLVRKNRAGARGEVTAAYQPELGRITNFAGRSPRGLAPARRHSYDFNDRPRSPRSEAYQ